MLEVLGWVVGAYLILGIPAALLGHAGGLRRIDPAVSGGGILFRVLITPGVIALWPVLVTKFVGRLRGREFLGKHESPVSSGQIRRVHLILALALSLLVAVVLVLAVLLRPARQPSRIENTSGQPASIPLE